MWVSPRFGADYVQRKNPELVEQDFVLTDELRRRFIEDPKFYLEYRKGMESHNNSLHGFTLLDYPMQEMFRSFIVKDMQEKLVSKPTILEKLLPAFPAGCRRVTPGCGFLEALVENNVTFRSEEIERFAENGVETMKGEVHEYDAIICATGLRLFFPSTISYHWTQRHRSSRQIQNFTIFVSFHCRRRVPQHVNDRWT